MDYLFDTNIFIESKKRMPFEIWPTFWTRMTELINSGQIHSIDKVKNKIDRGGDELTDWIRNHAPKGFFLGEDFSVIQKLSETLSWAKSCPIGFTQAAIKDYADVADSYLVATAAAKKMILVTFEKSNPNLRNRVMIPDACDAIGVTSCDLNSVFSNLGVTI